MSERLAGPLEPGIAHDPGGSLGYRKHGDHVPLLPATPRATVSGGKSKLTVKRGAHLVEELARLGLEVWDGRRVRRPRRRIPLRSCNSSGSTIDKNL